MPIQSEFMNQTLWKNPSTGKWTLKIKYFIKIIIEFIKMFKPDHQIQSSLGALLAIHSLPGQFPHLPTSQHLFQGSSIKL